MTVICALYHVSKAIIFTDLSGKGLSKMRVMLPNGTAMEIAKVVAVCEQRLVFNGRDMRLCERTQDVALANGLGLFTQVNSSFNVVTEGTVLLGNLSNEFVRGVLSSLAQFGWVDLTDLKLQEKQPLTTQYVFDNGKSGAYILQGFDANMSCADALPFVNGPFPSSEAEDVGERESEGEDTGEEDCNE